MHFHTSKEEGGRRFWLHFSSRVCLKVEAYFRTASTGIEFSAGYGDANDGIAVCIQMIGMLHISLTGVTKMLKTERVTGVTFNDGAISASLWHDWKGLYSGGLHWYWSYVNAIFGRREHKAEVLSKWTAVVPMPEGGYQAQIELKRAEWRRPRWPIVKREVYANVKFETPVPIEGKGESEWDCGEDAIYEMGVKASTVAEAVGAAVTRVFDRRMRHGTPPRLNAKMPTPI